MRSRGSSSDNTEASWGEKRVVYTPEPARRYVVRFMEARAEMIYRLGLREGVVPLVPSISPRGKMSFYTLQGVGTIKRLVERISGVRFDLRTLRRTYGQLLLDRGATIDAVSKAWDIRRQRPLRLSTAENQTPWCERRSTGHGRWPAPLSPEKSIRAKTI